MAYKLSPYQEELLDVYRRIAERGLSKATEQWLDVGYGAFEEQVDLWQHLLDELERFKL